MFVCHNTHESFKKRKLTMDANSVITAFIASSNQYVVNQSEDNLMQLQRHLEILVCLTTSSSDLGYFQNGNPLTSQCITHIVNLLLDSNVKCSLIPRVLSILQNLSKCSQLNKNLKSVFHVHSAISVFLQHYGIDVKDPLVLQCLKLLEKVTYDISIDYIESHFENLINALLKLTDTESLQLLKTVLRILTNLTRHNVKVQNYICSLPNSKQTIKMLVSILKTEEPHILVYALSLLSNLTTNYSMAKLWTPEHLMSTFKLIIGLLFGKDETCAIVALDLFLDLMKIPKYQSCFVKSPYLNTFFKRIPKVLKDDTIDQSVLYLQILYALIEIPDCYEKVCAVLCIPSEQSDNESHQNIKIHPQIVDWCISNDEIHEKARNISLKLLKSILSKNLDNFSVVEDSSREILKSILTNMTMPHVTETIVLEQQLEIYVTIFEIVILLISKSNMKEFISQYVNVTVCKEISQMVLDKCKIDEYESTRNYIHLFLMVLEVISVVESTVPGSEVVSNKILEDARAMDFLAYSLTSNNNECVKRSLLLVSLTKNECSLSALSKNLLIRNANIQKHLALNSDQDSSCVSDSGYSARKYSEQKSNSFEQNIDTLLMKIEQGLNIKELKRSEIMDLYEQKIAILTRKEQELQTYVEAKTAALQKADKIMTQYKCRQADSDAEALRLRTMLKDYESRCERAVMQFEEAQKVCGKQKEELNTALTKIRELQQHKKEQQKLMEAQMSRQYEQKKCFEEEKTKLSELLHLKDCDRKTLANQLKQMEEDMKMKCKAYEALEESKSELLKKIEELKLSAEKTTQNFEHKVLTLENAILSAQDAIASLETKNENLMNDMNKAMEDCNQQIVELESNAEELLEQLKLKDSKIADLNEDMKKINGQLNEKNTLLKDAEHSNEKLKLTLEKAENEGNKLKQDVKMLEMLCKRYEASMEKKDSEIKELTDELDDVRKQCEEEIEEKDKEINNLKAELENHKYITGMIHQITSGKIPPPKPD